MIHIAICEDEKPMSDAIEGMVPDFFHRKTMEAATVPFYCLEELLQYGKPIVGHGATNIKAQANVI